MSIHKRARKNKLVVPIEVLPIAVRCLDRDRNITSTVNVRVHRSGSVASANVNQPVPVAAIVQL